MIINIRGTNGSGKSHIVHCLLKGREFEEIFLGEEQVGVVVPELSLRIIGDYGTQCGGCDWLQAGRGGTSYSVQMVEDLVGLLSEDWMPEKHVLFEGFMISGTFGRWNECAARYEQKYGHGSWVFCFLDTPKEICAERIGSRRAERAASLGKTPTEFNPKNCYDGHRQGLNIRRNMLEASRKVIDIDHTRSYEQFMTEVFKL